MATQQDYITMFSTAKQSMWILSVILTYTSLLTSSTLAQTSSENAQVHFDVQEQVQDSLIGSLRNDAYVRGLFTTDQLSQLRFVLTPSPSQHDSLFRVDEITGDMTTAVSIDREQYCPYLQHCYLYIDVSITNPEFVVSSSLYYVMTLGGGAICSCCCRFSKIYSVDRKAAKSEWNAYT